MLFASPPPLIYLMGDAIILNDYEFTPVKKAKLTEQLFPNEKEIFKCSSCLKMIPNSLLNDHKCRDDNKGDIQTIGSIKFERSTADKYMCTVCKKLFHHLLMKPHANTHEKLDETPTKATSISKFDIQMKCVLMDVVKDKLAVCEQLKIAKSSSKSADERSVSPETTDHLIANSFAKSAVNIITKTSSPESKPIDLEPKKDLESKKVLKLPKEPKPASHSSKIHSTPKGVSSFHKENTSIASKIITKN